MGNNHTNSLPRIPSTPTFRLPFNNNEYTHQRKHYLMLNYQGWSLKNGLSFQAQLLQNEILQCLSNHLTHVLIGLIESYLLYYDNECFVGQEKKAHNLPWLSELAKEEDTIYSYYQRQAIAWLFGDLIFPTQQYNIRLTQAYRCLQSTPLILPTIINPMHARIPVKYYVYLFSELLPVIDWDPELCLACAHFLHCIAKLQSKITKTLYNLILNYYEKAIYYHQDVDISYRRADSAINLWPSFFKETTICGIINLLQEQKQDTIHYQSLLAQVCPEDSRNRLTLARGLCQTVIQNLEKCNRERLKTFLYTTFTETKTKDNIIEQMLKTCQLAMEQYEGVARNASFMMAVYYRCRRSRTHRNISIYAPYLPPQDDDKDVDSDYKTKIYTIDVLREYAALTNGELLPECYDERKSKELNQAILDVDNWIF